MSAEMSFTADQERLIHFGIRGMKWGVRKGSSSTGVSRARGAMIDRNDRWIKRMGEARAGKGRGINRAVYVIQKKVAGEKAANRYMNTRINNLKDQKARLKSGKVTLLDKIELFQTTTPLALVVSNRPK